MSIRPGDIKLYGSASMPDSDTPTAIGGAIATSKVATFTDLTGLVQAVSGEAGDTTQTVTVTYRTTAGVVLPETKTLTGRTVVAFAATMERLLKGVKSATCAGDVAVEAQTAERANTAQAGGGGQYELRQIVAYDGTTKEAIVSAAWASGAGVGTDSITLDTGASATNDAYLGMLIRMTDGAGGYRISKGFFFEKAPAEVMEVRRIFYDAAANPPGGATRTYYEKLFFKNAHATLALSAAAIREDADPTGLVTFAVATAKDDAGTNGTGNNRTVMPPSGVSTFDNADKAVPSGQLSPAEAIGVWLCLTLAAGVVAQKSTYTVRCDGLTT